MSRKRYVLSLVLSVLFVIIGLVQNAMGEGSHFVTLQAVSGVVIEVPRSWIVVSQDSEMKEQAETVAEALNDNSGSIGAVLDSFAVSAPQLLDGKFAIAQATVTLQKAYVMTQKQVSSLSSTQLERLNIANKSEMKGIEKTGASILSISELSKIQINGIFAFEYQVLIRDAWGHNRQCNTIVFHFGSKLLNLTTSYEPTEGIAYKAILDRIKRSIKISL